MPETQNKTALIWFRNDLRVNDNIVLKEAIKNDKNVMAVYCFDPRHFEMTKYGFKKTEKYRAKFLIDTITDLKQSLSKLNINLLTFYKKPESVIHRLVDEYNIDEIYLQKEWTQEEVAIVDILKERLQSKIPLFSFYDQFLYHPEDINMEVSAIPKVFSDFRRSVEKSAMIREHNSIPKRKHINISTEHTLIPTLNDLGFEDFETHPNSAFPFIGGETAALERLQDYFFETKKLGVYKKTRNGLIGADFSSKFSPWLANGSISAKMIYWEVKRFEEEHFKNDSTYWLIFELIWIRYLWNYFHRPGIISWLIVCR